jgi:hypothetical protein
MSNVVNLNKFRKAKAKAEKQGTTAANRRKHGRTKAEKTAEKAEHEKSESVQDGHKLDLAGPGPEDKDPA